jgi:hypothetical protein
MALTHSAAVGFPLTREPPSHIELRPTKGLRQPPTRTSHPDLFPSSQPLSGSAEPAAARRHLRRANRLNAVLTCVYAVAGRALCARLSGEFPVAAMAGIIGHRRAVDCLCFVPANAVMSHSRLGEIVESRSRRLPAVLAACDDSDSSSVCSRLLNCAPRPRAPPAPRDRSDAQITHSPRHIVRRRGHN